MQDYKSLCAAVVICSTPVSIQTDRLTDTQHWLGSNSGRGMSFQLVGLLAGTLRFSWTDTEGPPVFSLNCDRCRLWSYDIMAGYKCEYYFIVIIISSASWAKEVSRFRHSKLTARTGQTDRETDTQYTSTATVEGVEMKADNTCWQLKWRQTVSVAYLSFQFHSECIEIKVLESVRTVQDLFQRSSRIGILSCVIVLQCIDCHLACPVVRLRVNASWVQWLHVCVCVTARTQTHKINVITVQNSRCVIFMMMMKLPILPCAEKLEPVLSTAPKTLDNSKVSMVRDLWGKRFTKKVSFEFRVKGWWMGRVVKRRMD